MGEPRVPPSADPGHTGEGRPSRRAFRAHSRLRRPTRRRRGHPGRPEGVRRWASRDERAHALTAQNTVGVTAVHELPSSFVLDQLEAVWSDIGVDAAKTGMLFRTLIETVAAFLEEHPVRARRRPRHGGQLGREATPRRRGGGARGAVVPASHRGDAEPERGRDAHRARRRAAPRPRRAPARAGRAGGAGHGRPRRGRRRPPSTGATTTRSRSSVTRCGDARRGLHALGHARRPSGARRPCSTPLAPPPQPRRRPSGTGSWRSARATAPWTCSTARAGVTASAGGALARTARSGHSSTTSPTTSS